MYYDSSTMVGLLVITMLYATFVKSSKPDYFLVFKDTGTEPSDDFRQFKNGGNYTATMESCVNWCKKESECDVAEFNSTSRSCIYLHDRKLLESGKYLRRKTGARAIERQGCDFSQNLCIKKSSATEGSINEGNDQFIWNGTTLGNRYQKVKNMGLCYRDCLEDTTCEFVVILQKPDTEDVYWCWKMKSATTVHYPSKLEAVIALDGVGDCMSVTDRVTESLGTSNIRTSATEKMTNSLALDSRTDKSHTSPWKPTDGQFDPPRTQSVTSTFVLRSTLRMATSKWRISTTDLGTSGTFRSRTSTKRADDSLPNRISKMSLATTSPAVMKITQPRSFTSISVSGTSDNAMRSKGLTKSWLKTTNGVDTGTETSDFAMVHIGDLSSRSTFPSPSSTPPVSPIPPESSNPPGSPILPASMTPPSSAVPLESIASSVPPESTIPPVTTVPPATNVSPATTVQPMTTVPPATNVPPMTTVPPATTVPPMTTVPPATTVPPMTTVQPATTVSLMTTVPPATNVPLMTTDVPSTLTVSPPVKFDYAANMITVKAKRSMTRSDNRPFCVLMGTLSIGIVATLAVALIVSDINKIKQDLIRWDQVKYKENLH